MRKDFRISGSGGQGVVSLAILLANVYGVYENYEVAQTQSYGAAARGGASQAGLVVSDKPIDYIEVDKADVFVAFNEASFKTYYPKTKKDAIIFVDSTLVPKELYADIPAHGIRDTGDGHRGAPVQAVYGERGDDGLYRGEAREHQL